MITDWDSAYTNSPHVADAESIFASWPQQAANFRAHANALLDIPYGPSERQRLDLFFPSSEPHGVVMFLHGGSWMELCKSDWSHLAAGALGRGWAVAIPSYDLCPAVRIATITRQIAAALEAATDRASGPVILIGHSAGGHLAARMMCKQSPLKQGVRARLMRVVGISGLYDLRPLLRAPKLNRVLQLDEVEAAAESPALLSPLPQVELLAFVGSDELPEFRRQSSLLTNVWGALGPATRLLEEPARHHFNIIDGLTSPDTPLMRATFTSIAEPNGKAVQIAS